MKHMKHLPTWSVGLRRSLFLAKSGGTSNGLCFAGNLSALQCELQSSGSENANGRVAVSIRSHVGKLRWRCGEADMTSEGTKLVNHTFFGVEHFEMLCQLSQSRLNDSQTASR